MPPLLLWPGGLPPPTPSSTPPPPSAELHAASAFSFLDGASLPEDLVDRAAALELPAVALVDANGVYAAPRFFKAAQEAGIKPLVGAEVVLEDEPSLWQARGRFGPLGLVPDPKTPDLARSVDTQARLTPPPPAARPGYRTRCKLIPAAARGHAKGEARVPWDLLAEHAAGLHLLTGGEEGPLARELAEGGIDPARRMLERFAHLFRGRLHVELQRHRRREEEHRNQALIGLARPLRLPLLATNGVRYAQAQDKPLHDVLTAIRHHTPLDAAGRLLAAHRERHLKSAAEMARLFSDLPEALAAADELAQG